MKKKRLAILLCLCAAAGLLLTAAFAEEPPTQYTVTFEANGGTAVAPQTVDAGNTAIEPEVPTRGICTFDGWYCAESGESAKWNFDTPVTGNITLTAQWKAQYTVECYRMDITGEYPDEPTETLTRSGIVDSTVEVPVHDLGTGLYLDTEYKDAVSSGTVTADGTLVLKQYMAREKYTVTYDSNNGGFEGELTELKVTRFYGAAVEEPTTPIREGYTCAGWYDADTAELFIFNDNETAAIAGDLTLKALWQRNLSACIITVEPLDYTGKEQSPTIVVTDGDKTLTQWTAESTETGDYLIRADGDHVRAATEPGTYTLVLAGRGAYCGTVMVEWTINEPDKPAETTPAPTAPAATAAPAALDSRVPQTDDNGHAFLWLALAGLSLSALVVEKKRFGRR